jgi:hypothetical protein
MVKNNGLSPIVILFTILLTFSWVGVFSYTLNDSINGAAVQEVKHSEEFDFFNKVQNSKMFEKPSNEEFPSYANNFMYILSLMSIFVIIINYVYRKNI